jgi:hypothetical protein
VKNLHLVAAEAAQRIVDEPRPAKSLENLVTRSLGVLQDNGVYAAVLYLRSQTKDRDMATTLSGQLLALAGGASGSAEAELKFLVDNVCNDIRRLLLVKAIWEQTLIYTRYGAKAKGTEAKASTAASPETATAAAQG